MINHSLIEKACAYIPATPDMVVQAMTHIHDADENTFGVICHLFMCGYDPKDLADGLNELHTIIGVSRVQEMAKALIAIDVENWIDVYPILNQLTPLAVIMLNNLSLNMATVGDLQAYIYAND